MDVLPPPLPGTALRVLSTTDLGAATLPLRATHGESGTCAGIVALLERERDRVPAIWLDLGDFVVGHPSFPVRGERPWEEVADLPIAAAAVGNHEFDDGVETMHAAVARLGFPVLCANVDVGLAPCALVPTDAGPVGVIGLTHPAVDRFTRAPATVPDVAERVAALAEALRRDGARWVVVLLHDGVEWWPEDDGIATRADRLDGVAAPWARHVDLILCGHNFGHWTGALAGTPAIGAAPLRQLGGGLRPLAGGAVVRGVHRVPPVRPAASSPARDVVDAAAARVVAELPVQWVTRTGAPALPARPARGRAASRDRCGRRTDRSELPRDPGAVRRRARRTRTGTGHRARPAPAVRRARHGPCRGRPRTRRAGGGSRGAVALGRSREYRRRRAARQLVPHAARAQRRRPRHWDGGDDPARRSRSSPGGSDATWTPSRPASRFAAPSRPSSPTGETNLRAPRRERIAWAAELHCAAGGEQQQRARGYAFDLLGVGRRRDRAGEDPAEAVGGGERHRRRGLRIARPHVGRRPEPRARVSPPGRRRIAWKRCAPGQDSGPRSLRRVDRAHRTDGTRGPKQERAGTSNRHIPTGGTRALHAQLSKAAPRRSAAPTWTASSPTS